MGDFVVIDVETANAFMGSICQIGAVRYRAGQEVEYLSWLVDPADDFDSMNISIHGITPAMVRGQPHFRDRHAALIEFVGRDVAVSHTHFDRISLQQACAAGNLRPPECRWLDSARVARRHWPDVQHAGYGLANLAARLGISFKHHDALEDARAAGQVLLQLLAESGFSAEAWLDRCNRPITSQDVRRTGDGDGPLVGHTIVFTGALDIPRRVAADRAHDLGAAVAASVSARTTMLVVGDQDLTKLAGHAKSSKHRKAEAMIAEGSSIRIVAERDFMAF